jgi:hypothetical protein
MRRALWVLGVAVATLFSLAGCAMLGLSTAKAPPGSTVAPGSDATTTVLNGSAVPSTAPASAPLPSPTATLPSLPALPSTSPTTRASGNAGPCGYRQSGAVDGVTAVPGAGTLTVTWWHPGDPTVQSYRVAAVSQQLVYGVQPSPTWVAVTPATGCQAMTTTLSGLARNSTYVVWVDAVSKTSLGTTTDEVMVGRSSVISTT